MAHQDDIRAMLGAVAALNGVEVSLVRGGTETTGVIAIIGETIVAVDDGTGALTEARSRDFIIQKDDYRFAGVRATPSSDDYIMDSVSGELLAYQVLPFFGDEARRWSDPFGEAWRIHTKLATAAETAAVGGSPTFDSTLVTFDETDYTFDAME